MMTSDIPLTVAVVLAMLAFAVWANHHHFCSEYFLPIRLAYCAWISAKLSAGLAEVARFV